MTTPQPYSQNGLNFYQSTGKKTPNVRCILLLAGAKRYLFKCFFPLLSSLKEGSLGLLLELLFLPRHDLLESKYWWSFSQGSDGCGLRLQPGRTDEKAGKINLSVCGCLPSSSPAEWCLSRGHFDFLRICFIFLLITNMQMFRVSNYSHSLFFFFFLVPSSFRAGQALGMQQSCQSAASHPWTPGKWKYIPPTLLLHSMTKPCPYPSLGHDPLPYSLSPLWPLALVSVPRLQSPRGVFDPLSLFLPHTSLTIQKWDTRWKVWQWKSRRESLIPKQRWDAAKKPDRSHRCRHEQETQLAPSKKPLCCKQFLKMQGGDASNRALLANAAPLQPTAALSSITSGKWQGANLQEEQSTAAPSRP